MKKEIISYSTFLNKNENKNESSDKDMKLINNELYLNIDSRNKLKEESQKEYQSRVATCGRYLNELLESGREVIILTSLSHTTIEEEKIILNDIYATISDSNKPLFKIILTDVNDEKKQKQIMNPIDSGTGEKEIINALANRLINCSFEPKKIKSFFIKTKLKY